MVRRIKTLIIQNLKLTIMTINYDNTGSTNVLTHFC